METFPAILEKRLAALWTLSSFPLDQKELELQSSLPAAELALFCHCYYGEPALCPHALSPPPAPPRFF